MKICKFVRNGGMFFMELKIDFQKLDDIMKAFYSLTKIKIILFDENRNIIHSYPHHDCTFCRKIKSYEHTAQHCLKNDVDIFNECKKTGKLIVYTCHAGLVECCAPIKQNEKVLGYIMFGQISDLPSKNTVYQNVSNICRQYNLDEEEFLKASKSIKLKSHDDIMSSAKIFEACISYIILNEMLMPQFDKTMIECEKYIDAHLDNVNVEALCNHLDLSRTTLYDIFRNKTGQGVATFIRNKQLEKAKRLLTEMELSVSEVSSKCGFTDYNYFSRVFKKKYGYSAKSLKYRNF